MPPKFDPNEIKVIKIEFVMKRKTIQSYKYEEI